MTRVTEIDNEIEFHLQAIFNLQTEKQKFLSQTQQTAILKVQLIFNDNERIIKWNSSYIKVGQKTYSLIKLLWETSNNKATIDKIEKHVWNVDKKRLFVKSHTIFSLIRRAQKLLKSRFFPYKILTIKRRSTHEIKGYKLICAKITKK
jgi:DNA-binding response OmpR family regulator